MTDFGVTPQGFNRKQLTDIQSDIEASQRAKFGALLDVSAPTALGQMNGTFSSGLAEGWELAEEAYHAFDPDAAAGASLTYVAALTGTERREAKASTVPLTLNLNAGASVPTGSIVQHSTRPDIRFSTDALYTNPGGSAADIFGTATCTQTGPIAALASSLTVIITPASGWNSVFNPVDATVGRDVDSDVILRQRREDELALRGGSTVDAIRADLLDSANHPELAGIESVEVLENTSDAPDSNGLPGHSFEVVLDDGPTPTVLDTDIAQSIFDTGPGGIFSNGSVLANAIDVNGDPQPERFSRVLRRAIYVSLTVVRGIDYPVDGDAQVQAAIVAKGSLLLAGQSVVALSLEAAALTVAGVLDVSAYTQGFAPSPVLSANLTLGVRERATFAGANVVVS